jgi:hypothetical protein
MGNRKKSETRRNARSAKLHARFARHSKVISITRGRPAVRKLSIEREKYLREHYWDSLYLLEMLRERLGPVIADEIERRKIEVRKSFRARSGPKKPRTRHPRRAVRSARLLPL